MCIVQRKESTTVVDEIPDSLLLGLGHPFHWLLFIAVRPVHPVAKNYEQLKVFERISIQCLDVFNESDGDILTQKSRSQSVANVGRTVIAVSDQGQSPRTLRCLVNGRGVLRHWD